MEKFLLIIREDLEKMSKMTEEERFSKIPMMLKWVDTLIESGNYIGGEALQIRGRYVTQNQILSDGPFIEAKEGISGYTFMCAESLEQMADIARNCPLVQKGLGVIEVRPVYTMPDANNK
jgi:hypothetical protein